jgi:hypothetical protein
MSGAGTNAVREWAYQACHDRRESLAVEGKHPLYEDYADAVLDALLDMPVEQRMEAMGMTVYGTVMYDDETETDFVEEPIDVMPGASVFVETSWVAE